MLDSQTAALTAPLLAATTAAAGYVGKLLLEELRLRRAARARKIARLQQLNSLLHAARVAVVIQIHLAQRLLSMLAENHPGEVPVRVGYERAFAVLYERFTEEERDLHQVIRGYTEHALRPVNQSLTTWLREDTDYKVQVRPVRRGDNFANEFASLLGELDAHLFLWHAKFAAWIVDHPEHALLFLADEKQHGLGFPSKIDGAARRALDIVAGRAPVSDTPEVAPTLGE